MSKRTSDGNIKNVSFEMNDSGEPIGRTSSSNNEHYQSKEILEQRKRAKAENKDAIILDNKLAARPPIVNGEPDSDWTTNYKGFYQPNHEKIANTEIEWEELTPEQKKSRWNRKIVNNYTLKRVGKLNSNQNCNGSGNKTFCALMGGKIAKKTKRKRSCRSKKSRRHRKK